MTTTDEPEESATIRISPITFDVNVFVNNKKLGTANEAKEFRFVPRRGPNVLTLQSERFKTNFVTTIPAQKGSVHSARNIRYEPLRSTKSLLAIVSIAEKGTPFDGDAEADRLQSQKKYPRTAEFWDAVVAANAKAQKVLDGMRFYTFDRINKELKVYEKLGKSFEEIDEADVDPELVVAFKQMYKLYKARVPARRGVENGWNMIGVMSGLKGAAGDLSSLNLPKLVGDLQSAGDVLILITMGYTARLQSLHGILDVMEYRYGGTFSKIEPAYNSKNEMVGLSRKLVDALKEE